MIGSKGVKSLWSYNPIPRGCILYLPLWHPSSKKINFRSPDPYKHNVGGVQGAWSDKGWLLTGTEYLTYGTNSVFNITTGDFSLVIWAYLDTIGSHRIFFGSSSLDGFHLFSRNNEAVRLEIPNVGVGVAADTAMPHNTWAMVGVSFDNSEATNNCQYYRNGATDGLVSYNADGADYLNVIGAGNAAASWHWSGYLGEAWIYNRILSAGEFNYLYTRTRQRFE